MASTGLGMYYTLGIIHCIIHCIIQYNTSLSFIRIILLVAPSLVYVRKRHEGALQGWVIRAFSRVFYILRYKSGSFHSLNFYVLYLELLQKGVFLLVDCSLDLAAVETL
jgi:hypothetical protein